MSMFCSVTFSPWSIVVTDEAKLFDGRAVIVSSPAAVAAAEKRREKGKPARPLRTAAIMTRAIGRMRRVSYATINGSSPAALAGSR